MHHTVKQKKILLCKMLMLSAIGCTFASPAYAQVPLSLDLHQGNIADYGATPWYTDDVLLGSSHMHFALDTGTALLWATTDKCTTTACKAHANVNTSQPGFSWIGDPNNPEKVSFGPWGSMEVVKAKIPLNITAPEESVSVEVIFDGSVNYSGEKFQYLAWGGGIGFPSESSASAALGLTSIVKKLYTSKIIPKAVFTMTTDRETKNGTFIIGGTSDNVNPSTQVILPAKKPSNPDEAYLWGTNLVTAAIGGGAIPSLTSSLFYLDSGSSRFKAGRAYIQPILDQLYAYKDHNGAHIFDQILDENNQVVELKYARNKSPQDYLDILPDLTLIMGSSCNNDVTKQLKVSLSPEQYSYKVDIGENINEYVAAFRVLDGVEGLLVGSIFMDFIYSEFHHIVDTVGSETNLHQGEMIIYEKATGDKLKSYTCIAK